MQTNATQGNQSATCTVEQARRYIGEHLQPGLPSETVLLCEAQGRILSEDIVSAVSSPAYTNAAMDGWAFNHRACLGSGHHRIVGVSLAGHPWQGCCCDDSVVRITTGARIPDGCDTVVPYEKTRFDADYADFDAGDCSCGDNVRHAGENFRLGTTVLTRGTRLAAQHIALAASVGAASLPVVRRLRVAVVATGDELVEPGQPCPTDRLYNANAHALVALVQSLGAEPINYGIVADSAQALAQAVDRALASCDLLLFSGGAGNASADYTHELLSQTGQMAPWTVNMRPGRPMRFGLIQGRPYFILPGNPVAAFTTFHEFVRGAVLYLSGCDPMPAPVQLQARLEVSLKKKKGRAEFVRACCRTDSQGVPCVRPTDNQSSSALTSVTQANCLIWLDHPLEQISEGTWVTVHPLPGLWL